MPGSQDDRGPILIISGSLRRPSVSAAAARLVAEGLAASGLPHQLLTVGDLGLPIYDPNIHSSGCGVGEPWLAMARRCSAMVWSVPAYHRSMSGVFKNALDFLDMLADDDPPYLGGKFVGLISNSGGLPAALYTISAMIHSAHALRAFVLPYQVPIADSHRVFDKRSGTIVSDDVRNRVRMLTDEVLNFYTDYRPQLRARLAGNGNPGNNPGAGRFKP